MVHGTVFMEEDSQFPSCFTTSWVSRPTGGSGGCCGEGIRIATLREGKHPPTEPITAPSSSWTRGVQLFKLGGIGRSLTRNYDGVFLRCPRTCCYTWIKAHYASEYMSQQVYWLEPALPEDSSPSPSVR